MAGPQPLLPADLIALAQQVVTANAAAERRLVTAESCTGGLLSCAISEIPGCSAVLERGFVTYSNEAKSEMLGVPADIIDTFGAVSLAVAWAMAKGALARSQADVAVAVTGIAGPGGGTDQKPVGTVAFARAIRGVPAEESLIEIKQFGSDCTRAEVRLHAALFALGLMLP